MFFTLKAYADTFCPLNRAGVLAERAAGARNGRESGGALTD